MQSKVLVVDDDPMNIVIISEMLEDLCDVAGVESAQQALNHLKSEINPDLILLDVEMPEMTGYELIKIIKTDPSTKNIPVIFVTGHDDVESEEFGLTLGATDYIRKPLNYAITRSRIEIHLENKKAKDFLLDHNAYLEKEVRRRTADNEIIQNVSLSALAMLAEAKDNETGNHIIRTQKYVEVICNDLRENSEYGEELNDDAIKKIVKAAPLHDIGKVGIPDNILNKPGKFTPDEWEIMKTHAEIGAHALEAAIETVLTSELGTCNKGSFKHAVGFLEIGKQIARHHHEKWDGSGYPHGLSGRNIPLPARIMAIADVFDALIAKRCYKRAFSIAETFATIKDGKGSHFDPVVVESFERVCVEMVNIAIQNGSRGENTNDSTV